MKNKGTWGLLGVVVILSLYTYFIEYKGKEDEKESKTKQAVIFKDFNPEQVSAVEINNLEQKIVLSRTSSGWEVTSPTKDAADTGEIENWVKQLTEEKTLSTAVEGKEIQWQNFGFDQPVRSIKLTTTSNKELVIEVSGKKNYEGNSFIRVPGENKVLVAGPNWSDYAGKKVFELRNKHIFRHQVSNVQHVQIKNKLGVVEFESKEAKWITAKQPDLLLDQNVVRETIAKINEIKAIEFVGEKDLVAKAKKDLKLTASQVSVDIKLNEGTWSAFFFQTKDKSIYAEVPSAQLLVKIPNDYFDRLNSLVLADLRDLKLPFAAFDKYKVKKFSYETTLKKAALVKNGNNWDLDPPDTVNEVQQDKVSALMDVIKNLAGKQYLAKSELKKDLSKQRVIFKDGDEKVYFEVQFSESETKKVNNEEKTYRYAKTNFYSEPFMMEESEFQKMGLNDIIKIKVNNEGKTLPVEQKKEVKHDK